MNRDQQTIISILKDRDGVSTAEATTTLQDFEREARALATDPALDPWSALDSISEMGLTQLGLEPDYTEYLIHEMGQG